MSEQQQHPPFANVRFNGCLGDLTVANGEITFVDESLGIRLSWGLDTLEEEVLKPVTSSVDLAFNLGGIKEQTSFRMTNFPEVARFRTCLAQQRKAMDSSKQNSQDGVSQKMEWNEPSSELDSDSLHSFQTFYDESGHLTVASSNASTTSQTEESDPVDKEKVQTVEKEPEIKSYAKYLNINTNSTASTPRPAAAGERSSSLQTKLPRPPPVVTPRGRTAPTPIETLLGSLPVQQEEDSDEESFTLDGLVSLPSREGGGGGGIRSPVGFGTNFNDSAATLPVANKFLLNSYGNDGSTPTLATEESSTITSNSMLNSSFGSYGGGNHLRNINNKDEAFTRPPLVHRDSLGSYASYQRIGEETNFRPPNLAHEDSDATLVASNKMMHNSFSNYGSHHRKAELLTTTVSKPGLIHEDSTATVVASNKMHNSFGSYGSSHRWDEFRPITPKQRRSSFQKSNNDEVSIIPASPRSQRRHSGGEAQVTSTLRESVKIAQEFEATRKLRRNSDGNHSVQLQEHHAQQPRRKSDTPTTTTTTKAQVTGSSLLHESQQNNKDDSIHSPGRSSSIIETNNTTIASRALQESRKSLQLESTREPPLSSPTAIADDELQESERSTLSILRNTDVVLTKSQRVTIRRLERERKRQEKLRALENKRFTTAASRSVSPATRRRRQSLPVAAADTAARSISPGPLSTRRRQSLPLMDLTFAAATSPPTTTTSVPLVSHDTAATPPPPAEDTQFLNPPDKLLGTGEAVCTTNNGRRPSFPRSDVSEKSHDEDITEITMPDLSSRSYNNNGPFARHHHHHHHHETLVEATLVEEGNSGSFRRKSVSVASPVNVVAEDMRLSMKIWAGMVCICTTLIIAIVLVLAFGFGFTGGDEELAMITSIEEDNKRVEEQVVTPEHHHTILEERFQDMVYDPSSFDDLLSPQSLALQWMATEDNESQKLIAEENFERLRQRYLLTVFYYTMTEEGPWSYCSPPETAETSSCLHPVLESYANQGIGTDQHMSEPAFRWLSDVEECRWAGVKCEDGVHVSTLSLPGYGLRSSLPVEVAYLSSLKVLDLHHNQLYGPLPKEWGLIAADRGSSLESIHLDRNGLTGSLPAAWCSINTAGLEDLVLSENYLTGRLPDCVGNFFSLKNLSVMHNSMSGELPDSLAKLPDLQQIHLAGNSFHGKFPDELCSSNAANPTFEATADCAKAQSSDGLVECSCCTTCCVAGGSKQDCNARLAISIYGGGQSKFNGV